VLNPPNSEGGGCADLPQLNIESSIAKFAAGLRQYSPSASPSKELWNGGGSTFEDPSTGRLWLAALRCRAQQRVTRRTLVKQTRPVIHPGTGRARRTTTCRLIRDDPVFYSAINVPVLGVYVSSESRANNLLLMSPSVINVLS